MEHWLETPVERQKIPLVTFTEFPSIYITLKVRLNNFIKLTNNENQKV